MQARAYHHVAGAINRGVFISIFLILFQALNLDVPSLPFSKLDHLRNMYQQIYILSRAGMALPLASTTRGEPIYHQIHESDQQSATRNAQSKRKHGGTGILVRCHPHHDKLFERPSNHA